MKAYHFLRKDMRAGSGNEAPWTVGETRTIEGDVELCVRGYHSSPSLWQAFNYAPGPVACLVEIPRKGTKRDSDKSVSPSRKLVAAVNVDSELRLFAADCAEHVLYIFEREYPNDDRPRKAIEAARAYARGEITEATEAAQAAARDAARDAAWAAAGAAAWDAAWAAARAAAWDAARAAAGAAARDAARDAAWAAAGAAARDAAGDAEQAWQRKQFEQRFGRIFEEVMK